jgi:hypothetical protein
MAGEATPERSARPTEVTVISITMAGPPPRRGRPLREQLSRIAVRHKALTALAVTLAVAALATIGATSLERGGPSRPTAVQVPAGQRAQIAAALGYPYPLRCLSITISTGAPDYARADIDRTNGCGRYRGYINASLHRVGGAWRLTLDEGQLFVPNSLLRPCSPGATACGRPSG